jgi:Na+/H+ antiporter NhaD/arsenite permease-like protein
MSTAMIAFLVLIAAFAIGSFTPINAGLIALVAAFGVGTLLAGLPLDDVIAQFPAGLFLILVGATLMFAIVRITGTIDLLAYWAERLAGRRRLLVPVLMFLLTAGLATAGAFTPAAIAIVAPVALALGSRFGISTLAMGFVIVQGANAGAFSPVNPFGVLANAMLDEADASSSSLMLYVNCFAFNAAVAVVAYALVTFVLTRRARRSGAGSAAATADDPTENRSVESERVVEPASGMETAAATIVRERSAQEVAVDADQPSRKVEVTPMRLLTLAGIGALLVLTTVFGIDVGVATLGIALALIIVNSGVQKAAIDSMPWSAILLVTGIVTYVGMLEEMGALKELEALIAGIGSTSIAALLTCQLVAIVSAFASTTGTLGVISPIVAPIAADPMLSALGVITAISISSSVVDVSPMSTSGALLMASAQPKDERLFFRALLLYAVAMIVVVPTIVWFIFVQLAI